METVRIGIVLKPFGLKGEMRVRSTSDFFVERCAIGQTVYLRKDQQEQSFVVATNRFHKGFYLVSFEDYQDINLIEAWSDADLLFDRAAIPPLDEGYYFSQLVGLQVQDEAGKVLGIVDQMEEGLAHNFLLLKQGDQVKRIPFVDAFIKKVDLDNQVVVIHVIEGLV